MINRLSMSATEWREHDYLHLCKLFIELNLNILENNCQLSSGVCIILLSPDGLFAIQSNWIDIEAKNVRIKFDRYDMHEREKGHSNQLRAPSDFIFIYFFLLFFYQKTNKVASVTITIVCCHCRKHNCTHVCSEEILSISLTTNDDTRAMEMMAARQWHRHRPNESRFYFQFAQTNCELNYIYMNLCTAAGKRAIAR